MANDTITIFPIAVGVSLYNTMGNVIAKAVSHLKSAYSSLLDSVRALRKSPLNSQWRAIKKQRIGEIILKNLTNSAKITH